MSELSKFNIPVILFILNDQKQQLKLFKFSKK